MNGEAVGSEASDVGSTVAVREGLIPLTFSMEMATEGEDRPAGGPGSSPGPPLMHPPEVSNAIEAPERVPFAVGPSSDRGEETTRHVLGPF